MATAAWFCLAAAAHPNTDSTPFTCDQRTVKFHRFKARGVADAMFAHKKWKDATPVKREQKAWFRWHIACVYDPPTDHRLRAYVRAQKRGFYRYRNTGGPYTPYGKYAIPQYILDCESYGGSWSASNGTHVGPYSLSLDLYGPPWPVNSWADKIEHHRIAHGLWAGGSGISHWAACA